MKKVKINTTTDSITVEEVVERYGSPKMAVVKSFQRRVVWQKHNKNEYIGAVSAGLAVTPVVVADIQSGIDRAREHSDKRSLTFYKELFTGGARSISEDGQNRIATLIDFVKGIYAFSGCLYDLDDNPREFTNIMLKDLPESYRYAFLNTCRLAVTTISGVPSRNLSDIFISLNSGEPLNTSEIRQAKQTPIASWVRNHAEGTYVDMWPRIGGLEKKLKRMSDIRMLSEVTLAMNSHTHDHSLDDKHLDKFYDLGVDRSMSSVVAYSPQELHRVEHVLDEVQKTIELQETVPDSKQIPLKTFWALVYVTDHLHNNGYQVDNHEVFYDFIYETDCHLEAESKNRQTQDRDLASNDPTNADKKLAEIHRKHPDNDYYWRWITRNQDSKHRLRRIDTLVTAVMGDFRTYEKLGSAHADAGFSRRGEAATELAA